MRGQFVRAAYLAVPLSAAAADQASKWLVRNWFEARGAEAAVVIPGFLNLVGSSNPGGAFGILPGAPWFFFAVSLVLGSCAIAVMLFSRLDARISIALGLVGGGAMGNLVDRVRFGEVYDFLDVHAGAQHWPAFNAADVFLVAGIGIMIVSFALPKQTRAKTP
ncbi:MAG: signal peptidase II [bacterium]